MSMTRVKVQHKYSHASNITTAQTLLRSPGTWKAQETRKQLAEDTEILRKKKPMALTVRASPGRNATGRVPDEISAAHQRQQLQGEQGGRQARPAPPEQAVHLAAPADPRGAPAELGLRARALLLGHRLRRGQLARRLLLRPLLPSLGLRLPRKKNAMFRFKKLLLPSRARTRARCVRLCVGVWYGWVILIHTSAIFICSSAFRRSRFSHACISSSSRLYLKKTSHDAKLE